MALTVLAETYADRALETIIQGTLSAPFVLPDNQLVEWSGAKTFSFFGIKTPGMRNRGRDGAGAGGSLLKQVENFEQTFTLSHDRYVNMHLDKADIDETGGVINPDLSVQNFIEEQWNPEIDSYFFSTVATEAISIGNFSATDNTTLDKDNIYAYIKGIVDSTNGDAKLRRYASKGNMIMYVSSQIMSLLEISSDFTRTIEQTTVGLGGIGLETRVTSLDGIRIVEVVEIERFYTSFNFSPTDDFLSFEALIGSFPLNALVATVGMTRTVPKFSDIYVYSPGEVQGVQGYVMDIYPYWDTFVFENNKSGGIIDHIFVDRHTVAVA